MAIFLVRVSEHSGLPTAQEFVGVVAADSIGELSALVDEFTDPGMCEYTKLPGGMIFARENAPPVPFSRPETADDDVDDTEQADFWSGAAVTGGWAEFFNGEAFRGSGASAWMSFDDLKAPRIASPPRRRFG